AAVPAHSYDSAEEAAAAGAKICAAAPKDFPLDETMPEETLKERLLALGAKPNLEGLDSSCGLMTLGGMRGFAAMPTLHLGNNNRQDVGMMLEVGGRDGKCLVTIVRLDGC